MITEVLKTVARCLDSAAIPYMIMGGQAVLQYGEARMTRDIDLTIALTPDEIDKVLFPLQSCGFSPIPADVREFVNETWVLPVEHTETGVRVDIVFSILPFERNAIADANEIDFGGVRLRFIKPEYLVVQKIVSGRPRDIEDVEGIVNMQRGSLDVNKTREMLEALGRETGNSDWIRIFEEVTKRR